MPHTLYIYKFLELGVEMNRNLGCPRDNENVSYTGNRYISMYRIKRKPNISRCEYNDRGNFSNIRLGKWLCELYVFRSENCVIYVRGYVLVHFDIYAGFRMIFAQDYLIYRCDCVRVFRLWFKFNYNERDMGIY